MTENLRLQPQLPRPERPPAPGLAWLEQPYEFASPAEADATYLVIAWFAITESASIGIFPLLSALEISRKQDPGYFARFFEQGFQHFTDEQQHANMWCRALLDFTEKYPEVVRRVELPRQYLKIMLKSIGKPHSVLGFAVDCLAFEVVMQALYEVMQPRMAYPPVAHILKIISRDEVAHTDFGRDYLREVVGPLSTGQRVRVAFRYWRNTLGVLFTIEPMLKAISRYQPLPPGEFRRKLAHYARNTGIIGHQFVPDLLSRLD